MDNEQGKRWLWFEKLTQIACQYFESEGDWGWIGNRDTVTKKKPITDNKW